MSGSRGNPPQGAPSRTLLQVPIVVPFTDDKGYLTAWAAQFLERLAHYLGSPTDTGSGTISDQVSSNSTAIVSMMGGSGVDAGTLQQIAELKRGLDLRAFMPLAPVPEAVQVIAPLAPPLGPMAAPAALPPLPAALAGPSPLVPFVDASDPAFGSFYDTTTQAVASTVTAYVVAIGSTFSAYRVAIVSGTRITVADAGSYAIQYSLQLTNTDAAAQDVQIWLRKNGSDVPFSNSRFTVPAKHGAISGKAVAVSPYVIAMSEHDYVEFWWQADNVAVQIETIAAGAGPTTPVTPGVDVFVEQV